MADISTESAALTALAALGWESPQEPSRFWESAFAAWSGWPTSEVLPAANAWRAYEAHLATYKRARDDQRAPLTAVEKLAKRGMPARDAALLALEPVVRAGLERRAGTFLAPAWMLPMHPAMAADLIGWQIMQFLMRVLAVRWEGELCVCEACTAVFRTRGRKRRAKHCDLCRDHPAKPPLGFGRYGPFDLGAQVPTRAGQRVTVRVPVVVGDRGVSGWRYNSFGLSDETAEPYTGRHDKRGSAADRKRRARRASS